MVAAGVPKPRKDHAKTVVLLALEMRSFITNNDFDGRKLEIRFGINSGPLVAESHGEPNVIQITICVPKGTKFIKGKGEIPIYHVESQCTINADSGNFLKHDNPASP